MDDGRTPGDDDSDEDLPPELRDLVATDPAAVVALYNGLQEMDDDAFRAAFEGSLETLKDVTDGDEAELAAVLGLELDDGTVAEATLLSVHVRGGDRVVFTNDGAGVPDATVYVPVRPDDFPPGTGGALSDLGIDDYREVVSAMVFLRHQLYDESPDRLESNYREPLRRGLRAYAEE